MSVAALVFVLLFVCGFGLSVSLFAFWVWMIVDCAVNEPSEGNDKLVWILVIVLGQWIGALVYFFARRPRRRATYGK